MVSPDPAPYGRALIIDQSAVFPVSVCRSLARRGTEVHVFAEAGSPMLRSRYCHRGITSGSWTTETEYLARLDRVVDEGRYETIYVASEPIVQLLVRQGRGWPALPLPPPAAMAVILSKHGIVRRVADRGAPVPRSLRRPGPSCPTASVTSTGPRGR